MNSNHAVGPNKVIPVMNKEELSEDNVQVAAIKYVAGVVDPLEPESDSDVDIKDTKKTVETKKKVTKILHKKKEHDGPETAPQIDMYIRVKQLSLFPSIY